MIMVWLSTAACYTSLIKMNRSVLIFFPELTAKQLMLYPKVVSIVIIPVVLSLGIVFMYYIVILN